MTSDHLMAYHVRKQPRQKLGNRRSTFVERYRVGVDLAGCDWGNAELRCDPQHLLDLLGIVGSPSQLVQFADACYPLCQAARHEHFFGGIRAL